MRLPALTISPRLLLLILGIDACGVLNAEAFRTVAWLDAYL